MTTADCVLWEPCLEDVPVVGQYLEYAETVACRPWELNWPDGNQPVTETLILDPDGCIRRGIRDVLDRLPPTGWEVSVLPSLPNLSWP